MSKGFTLNPIIAAEQIADLRAELARAQETGLRSDLALQKISLMLGGTDEWTDQETMIAYVLERVEVLAQSPDAIRQARESEREDAERTVLARYLAHQDGIDLLDIKSTVGPAGDADNWRKYLGKADDWIFADRARSQQLEARDV